MRQKNCLIILGPTAVGKTALSIKIAQAFQTQIISADSRQCYREMNIGVCKPAADQLQTVPHYFISSHSIHDQVNAAVFEQYALAAIRTIFEHNDVAVMAGGTGLYIRAFCSGMDEVPVIVPDIRKKIREEYNNRGLEWLQTQVKSADPEYFSKGEVLNPHRLIRSLEVVLSTGRSILSFHTGQKTVRRFNIIKVGLELPRQQLYTHINHRVNNMMQRGLTAEVTGLLPFKHLSPLNTIGYKELIECIERQGSQPETIEKIKINTRHYAKRQITWFKKDENIQWFSPEDEEGVLRYVRRSMDG